MSQDLQRTRSDRVSTQAFEIEEREMKKAKEANPNVDQDLKWAEEFLRGSWLDKKETK
jgi:hypothetical protein